MIGCGGHTGEISGKILNLTPELSPKEGLGVSQVGMGGGGGWAWEGCEGAEACRRYSREAGGLQQAHRATGV